MWSPPEMPAGTVRFYTVLLNQGEAMMMVDEPTRMALFDGLEPFTDYSISVSASTITGEGPQAETPTQTAQDGECIGVFSCLDCPHSIGN